MSEVIKGFRLIWENNDSRTVDTEVDVAVSRATGVWLADGGGDEGTETFRMIVGRPDEADAARAYAAHRKAHGHATTPIYRLFPLLSTEPIPETQLGDGYEETWAAFSDAWIEVRL
jgi:hypothetical protein